MASALLTVASGKDVRTSRFNVVSICSAFASFCLSIKLKYFLDIVQSELSALFDSLLLSISSEANFCFLFVGEPRTENVGIFRFLRLDEELEDSSRRIIFFTGSVLRLPVLVSFTSGSAS